MKLSLIESALTSRRFSTKFTIILPVVNLTARLNKTCTSSAPRRAAINIANVPPRLMMIFARNLSLFDAGSTYLPGEKHTWQEPFKERSWRLLKENYPIDARFSAKVINGVNFICLDDVFGTVQPDQVERFRAEAGKGLPMILCMHVPFHTPAIWRASAKFWRRSGKFGAASVAPDARGDYKRQLEDPVTRDFIAYLKSEPLLKGILTGHLHITVQDRFSPTAMQYVVGGNFMFHGEEVLFT